MRRRSGFTIVDVLVTIIIIGILASIMIPKFQKAHRDANLSARAALIYIYNRAAQRFETDTDLYPASLADLAATSAPLNGLSYNGTLTPLKASRWHGPYVSAVANDPLTGSAFIYSTSGTGIGTASAPAEVASAQPADPDVVE